MVGGAFMFKDKQQPPRQPSQVAIFRVQNWEFRMFRILKSALWAELVGGVVELIPMKPGAAFFAKCLPIWALSIKNSKFRTENRVCVFLIADLRARDVYLHTNIIFRNTELLPFVHNQPKS